MITAKNISKIYKLYADPKDRMKEALHPFRKKYHTDFYALKDVSFDIKKGETVGIIGKNGAGKSTLLKILTGVLTPSSGSYEIGGKIASLLELGAGFNPELSGLENVYFNGSVIGYTKVEMDQKIEAILEFADIGEFIHQPVKTYSSGMYVRLAFAVAINVDPEVLIVDEALSVGDMRFQLKCFRKLEEIKNNGTTILFVTHDTGAVINHCDRAIWLHDGGIKELGKPDDVCKHYMSFMAYGAETEIKKGTEEVPPLSGQLSEDFGASVDSEGGNNVSLGRSVARRGHAQGETKKIPWKSVAGCESFGEGGAEITHVAFYDPETLKSLEVLEGGEAVCLSIKIGTKDDIEKPIVGFTMKDQNGNDLLGLNNLMYKKKLECFKRGQVYVSEFKFDFPSIRNSDYVFSVAIAEGSQENHIQHHWVHDLLVIKVLNHYLPAKMNMTLVAKGVHISLKK